MARRPSPKPPARAADPFRDLKVGDHVMLSPAYIDPIHWYSGTVEWITANRDQILCWQGGIADQNPHHQLHSLDYVRVFGTLKHCSAEKEKASRAVRDAARMVNDLTDQARDLSKRLCEVFEALAADALKSCGGA